MFPLVSAGAQLLVFAIFVLAAFLIAQVALVVAVCRVKDMTTRQRLAAVFLPLAAQVLGWQKRKHHYVIVWGCLLGLYAVLRITLALR